GEQVESRGVHVHAPAEREPDPDQVERERPRREAELACPLVAVDQLPEHEQGGAERDRVERDEELVVREMHAKRDEGEGRVGDEPRLAPEEHREERAEHDRPENRCHELWDARRRERRDEKDGADSRVAEARDPVPARARDEQNGEADARNGPCNLGEPDHFGLTRTSAVAECPRSVTTRRYVPGVVGARRWSNLPRRRPRCWPRRHL